MVLMKVLRSVFQMAHLIDPMKEKLSVLCLDCDLEKKLVLHFLLLMVLMKGLVLFIRTAPLVVLMKEHLRVFCLDLYLALSMLLKKANVKVHMWKVYSALNEVMDLSCWMGKSLDDPKVFQLLVLLKNNNDICHSHFLH